MAKPPPSLLPLVLAALTLTGCTTTGSLPATPAAPVPALEPPPARITGSEEKSAMLDNLTVHIAAVDGVPVAAGREGWANPLSLKAGRRKLTLVFNRGVFTSRAEIEFAATSEAAYEVRFATDAQLFGKSSYCEFWIADAATGQPVTQRVRAALTRIEPMK
ncbi:MAG: hypothetical protein ACOZE5_01830 [Verrucomicrobiota bacterium]